MTETHCHTSTSPSLFQSPQTEVLRGYLCDTRGKLIHFQNKKYNKLFHPEQTTREVLYKKSTLLYIVIQSELDFEPDALVLTVRGLQGQA